MPMLKLAATVVIGGNLATPPFADTYWMVRNTAAKQCLLVQQDQKPSGASVQVIGAPK